MKIKQRTTCQACRTGKISCDGKNPACSQCLFRDRKCPGYPADWVFVSHPPHNDPKVGVRGAISRRARGMLHTQRKQVPSAQIVKPVPLPATPSLSDLVLTIIDNYVPEADTFPPESSVETSPRICGSWVEILPDIIGSGRDEALASAIRAFAISILSRGPKRSFAISEGLEAYNHALISVNHALRSPYSDFPVAIAAAVMCLLLAEFFHATSLGSWAAHLQGLADLMQLSRPEFYGSGIPHRLFVGARPVLMVLAFSSRKSSFLAREDWKSIPFRETPPSPVQSLMSEAAAIPSILERIDAEGDGAAEETLPAFEAALDRLDAWADGFCSSAPESSPMFWIRPSEDAERSSIWFRNITVANALTHFWAFKVICLRNIDELRTSRAHPNSNQGTEMAYFEEVKRLSVMICQSIEYLMQDRMKLFGPQSVPMPLHTAHEAFEAGVDRSRDELSWCREILKDLKNRGYAFM